MRCTLASIATITTLALAGCSATEPTADAIESTTPKATVPLTVQLVDAIPLDSSVNVDDVNCSMTSGINKPGTQLTAPAIIVKDADGTVVGKSDVTKDGMLVEHACMVQAYVGRVAESDFYQIEFTDVYGTTHTATGERGDGADVLIPVSF